MCGCIHSQRRGRKSRVQWRTETKEVIYKSVIQPGPIRTTRGENKKRINSYGHAPCDNETDGDNSCENGYQTTQETVRDICKGVRSWAALNTEPNVRVKRTTISKSRDRGKEASNSRNEWVAVAAPLITWRKVYETNLSNVCPFCREAGLSATRSHLERGNGTTYHY